MMLAKINKISRVFHRNSSIRLCRNYAKLGNFRLISSRLGKITKMEHTKINNILKKLSKKQVNSWINFKPSIGITKKPSSSRLGKGKAKINYLAANVCIGMPILEIKGLNYILISKVLNKISNNLSVNCKIQYSSKWWF